MKVIFHKKIYNFLFMPYIPLLKWGFSYKVMNIPDITIGAVFYLATLILDKIYEFGFSFSAKLLLLLIFQALFSLVFYNAKPLDMKNDDIIREFKFDKSVAIISLLTTFAVVSVLLGIYLHLRNKYEIGEIRL